MDSSPLENPPAGRASHILAKRLPLYTVSGVRLQTIVILGALSCPGAPPAAANGDPAEERAWEAAHDKQNIRHSAGLRRDVSRRFLTLPSDYREPLDFDVAHTPPEIDFGIIQGLEPEYLSEIATERSSGAYGGWGDVTKGPDGCFYFAIGNHMSYDGGNAYIIRYDPATKTQKVVLSTAALVGWGPDDYADGKVHGDLDIAPNGEMWMLTYFGPVPSPRDWDKAYRGGTLIRYHVKTGEKVVLGIPLEGDSWPYHNWDWQRNLLFAAGHRGRVLVYDTKARRMLYGGAPPDGIRWNNRAILVDRSTGAIYTTDTSPVEEFRHRFVRYQRRNHEFVRMKARVPANPVTGEARPLRAHTEAKDAGGAFWCFDQAGTFFKFYPEEDRTELVGVNWGRSGKYTTNIAASPKGRYLYYLPGADRRAWEYGTPVVQYDTRSGRKKVIAFLYDYYLDRYGYAAYGTYGLELDPTGASLFFFMDGRFTQRGTNKGARRPSMFMVHIPASERVE